MLANTQPTATITAVAQQSNTKSAADQPTSAQSINPITAGLGAAVSAIKIKEKPTVVFMKVVLCVVTLCEEF